MNSRFHCAFALLVLTNSCFYGLKFEIASVTSQRQILPC